MTSITSNYTESRCSKDNAALLLIDHQAGTMRLNHDPTPVEFRQAVIALAKVPPADHYHLELRNRPQWPYHPGDP